MGILEEVTSMQSQGFGDEEITNTLREKGVSPKEIKDALSQIKIKNAISEYDSGEEDLFKNQSGGNYSPNSKEVGNSGEYSPQDYSQQEYMPSEDYGGYAPSSGIDSNTIIELSEQVFSEKMKSVQGELNNFNEFKNLNQVRIENLNERLKRMEIVFDKLQLAILEKIGSYGQNLESIKKEMGMMQDSFSKVIEPVLDKTEKKQYIPRKKKVYKSK